MPDLQLDDAFFPALWTLAMAVQTRPEVLLAVWLAESGLDPRAKNSIGCLGLNQSCPLPYGPGVPNEDSDAYQQAPASRQLAWIAPQVVQGYHLNRGPFRSAARYYQANFLPATMAFAKADGDVVAAAGGPYPSAYRANTVLDAGAQGAITLHDLGDFVARAIARSPDLWALVLDRTYASAPPGAPWSLPDLVVYEPPPAPTSPTSPPPAAAPSGRGNVAGAIALLAVIGATFALAGAHR